jgi:hypothetical protein
VTLRWRAAMLAFEAMVVVQMAAMARLRAYGLTGTLRGSREHASKAWCSCCNAEVGRRRQS